MLLENLPVGKSNTMNNEVSKEQLEKIIASVSWGEVSILIKGGKITFVKKTETFAPKESGEKTHESSNQ